VTLFCAASDLAFVGGSLVPVGGHNLLEPAALGVPIITGPYVFNSQEVVDSFMDKEACCMVADKEALVMAVDDLLIHTDRARELGTRGLNILNSSRGALKRLLEVIDPLIESQIKQAPLT